MDDIRLPKPTVKFDDFARLDLRVGRVLAAREHANADKLLVLSVDLGIEQRQICAPLKHHYQPADLIGKLLVVVINLEPRTMRGELSQGMVLTAAEGPLKQHVVVVSPAAELVPGSPVS